MSVQPSFPIQVRPLSRQARARFGRAGVAVLSLLALTAPGADTPAGIDPMGDTTRFPLSVSGPAAVPPAIREKQEAVSRRPTAVGYRSLAKACEAAGLYQQAAEAYRREASLYRLRGDVNAARVEDAKADWLTSRVALYREVEVPYATNGPAKFEPGWGCYVGAIIERDHRYPSDYDGFNRLTRKQHAIFFDYRKYGMPFPWDFVQRVREAGGGVQIAFEPTDGLDEVKDDEYLREFAQQAAESDTPIFLRFASEMNGDWTEYGQRPGLFKEKWKLVWKVMRRYAPNVAMVWTPNATPEHNIPDYYPGDQYVDWVGVNFYSVHHHNNRINRPGDREDPADTLEYVYQRYAAKKPIMICEYAATHYCKADTKLVPDFARDKMHMLYSAIPRRYPRVKAIQWYDINNMAHAEDDESQTNNYSLTENPEVLRAYREAVRSPYFLSSVETERLQENALRYEAVTSGSKLSGLVRLSAGVKTYADRPTVALRVDGKPQVALVSRPYEFEWDTTRVSNGVHKLELQVVVKGREATRLVTEVRVQN